ncbi:hypothetical protein [Bacillus bingmayongensis]|uniref:hypothetical protein n=1 Tax=Bacillus bingmayongensis TaxID=1150157 RepID=UPI000371D390|nr:hypothetical protein [Bacillus bingmayongensis]MBY0596143.1 hypothetical protein [Bacillus bingmayongensis]
MRYTRGKQLALYVCKGANEDYKRFKKMRGAIGNMTIEENVTLPPYCNEVDPTFRWERGLNAKNTVSNLIFFRRKSGELTVMLAKESTQKLIKQGWIK